MNSVSENESVAAHNRQVRKHCDPLFLNTPFMTQGHDRTTPNATMTFLEYQGIVYGVTCGHVLDEVARTKQGQEQLALQLIIDHCVLNLGNFDASGFRPAIVRLKDDSDPTLDLAAMDFPQNFWGLLAERKGKVAIDLDQLSATDPIKLRMGLAFGYFNEHKRHVANSDGVPMVATDLAMVVATLNPVRKDDRQVTLSDELPQTHGYYFSGMSGGPIFGQDDEGCFHFLGIVTQGAPGSAKAWSSRGSDAFLSDASILVRGVRVTKARWAHWLSGHTNDTAGRRKRYC